MRGSAQDKNLTARANEVWENTCYDVDLFTVGGHTLTKAEAFVAWGRRVCSADERLRRWDAEAMQLESGECRELDPALKEERRRALMDARGLSTPTALAPAPSAQRWL